MKRFALAVLAATALPAGAAIARNDSAPPPSGDVIHLFGPNSVFNNILPSTQSSAAAPDATGSAASANAPSGTPASTPASTAADTPASTSGGGWGDVLHEMFVTGDPNVPASERLSKGRAGGN